MLLDNLTFFMAHVKKFHDRDMDPNIGKAAQPDDQMRSSAHNRYHALIPTVLKADLGHLPMTDETKDLVYDDATMANFDLSYALRGIAEMASYAASKGN